MLSADNIDWLPDGLTHLPAASIEQISVLVQGDTQSSLESFVSEWGRIDDALSNPRFVRLQIFDLRLRMILDEFQNSVVSFDVQKMLPKLYTGRVLRGWIASRRSVCHITLVVQPDRNCV